MSSILKAKRKPYVVWDAKTLDGDESKYGLDGSFTQVIKTYSPPSRGVCEILEGDNKAAARKLGEILLKQEVLTKR
jgi:electron transfer flavoprotein beta subunit